MGKTSAGYRRMYVVGTVTPMKKATAAAATLAIWDEHNRRLKFDGVNEGKFIFLDEN